MEPTTTFCYSDALDQFATALNLAQKDARAANKSSKNPYFNSKYADLPEIIEVHKQCFAKHGFSVTQWPLEGSGDTIRLCTMVLHASGQWMRATLALPVVALSSKKKDDGGSSGKPNAQAYGSAISYARRYAMAAALGIAADEDDDANSASGNSNAQPEPLAEILKPISEALDRPALDRICAAIAGQHPSLKEQIKQAFTSRKAVLDKAAA